MLDQYDLAIGKIYAAATDSSRWEEALHSIEDLTGSVGAVIGFVPKSGPLGFNLAGRFTLEQCATYTTEFQPICRRTRHMIEHPEIQVHYDRMLITDREMDLDPVYEWFGQHGLRYFVGAALPETRHYHPIFTLQRSPAQGHVEPHDIGLFERLVPHVGRALALADQLGILRSYDQFSSAIIEKLPHAIFALDGSGRLMFANGVGQNMLGFSDGLTDEAGHLQTSLRQEQATLDSLIRCAIAPLDCKTNGWMRISRPSGRLPYAVFVSPLTALEGEPLSAAAKVLVVVHDTGAQHGADLEMLAMVYGLTETEARLAAALSTGHSIESAASLLSMQPATARAHLKAIFPKLGVHRQQDLTRLLAFLSTLHLQA